MIESFLLTLFFTGLLLVVANHLTYDRPVNIQYRYLPRDLDDYVRTEPRPSAVFGSMWESDLLRGGDGGDIPTSKI